MLIAINKKLRAFGKNEKGFTMLEVLMVLVVLGIVAGVLAPKLFDGTDAANKRADEIMVEKLNAAGEIYRLDVGSFPPNVTALNTAPTGVTGWNGPYINEVVTPKQTGKVFKVNGGKFEIGTP